MIHRKPSRGAMLALSVFIIAFHFLCISTTYGAPVWGEIFTFEQPDGKKVDVRIWGDEFYRVVESLDGYTLTRDPNTGEICYARLSSDGNSLVSTGVRVDSTTGDALGLEPHIRINPEARRSIIREARQAALESSRDVLAGLGLAPERVEPPCNGNVQGICLIVDFSDEVATVPAGDIEDYCNLPGYSGYGNNGSVRDYFYDVSDGNLTYTNYVPTAYYRAQNPKSYYDDCDAPYGERARELVIEALTDLDNSGFDFSQYDSNGDGLIDAINCFYAGVTGCPWAEGLWPHSWTVSFSADGVDAFRYQITGIGSTLRLSTFCHENGHMICYWPDLYDYDHDSYGVGKFCIMCSSTSSTNPQEPCAYLKHIAGWTTTTFLTTPHTIATLPSDSNTIYKYEHPILTNEYYLFENRQKVGRDVGLPDAGIAIWHVDTEGSNSDQDMTPESHYECTLVQADGNWDLENWVNRGDLTDLWEAPTHTECTPFTNPNTNWWDGSSSALYVTDVSVSSTVMTFIFNRQCQVQPTDIDFGMVAVGDSLDETFTIINVGVDPLIGSVSESCDAYSIVSGGNYNILPGDSQVVTVRFAPTSAGTHNCTIQLGSTFCSDVYCTGEAYDPVCAIEPDTLDYGNVPVGGFESLSFTITNIGSELLAGQVSESCDRFLITSDPYYVLDPGEFDVVTVTYLPGAIGADTCWIETGYDLCKDVICIGVGVSPPVCLIEPDTLDFGAVLTGDYKDSTFIITNVGGDTLSGSVSETCGDYSIISGDGAYSLASGETLTVAVRFEPTGNGPLTCTVETGSALCVDVTCLGTGIDVTPPPPPEEFSVAYNTGSGNQLIWRSCPASDFGMFKIYRSENPGLLLDAPMDTTWQEIYSTSDTTWTDTASEGWQYRYEVTALDTVGNESPPTSPGVLTGAASTGVPRRFALYQSAPNPFNPSTVITYDVPPGGGKVTIRIFDVKGRLVKTLVNKNQTAGQKTVTWDGRNDRGEKVATGVFFYRMRAPGCEKTMKMTLLK
ncbi:MAG: M6 family metalloprotease domain-containing protein [Candidatus Latescibacterota bacterium]|nr:MAG: M6 family metalloprotease domain-containing protein [Candidatus Latescibacterota bacterium]